MTTDAELLDPQDWTFPVPIAYGPGRLAEIGARCHTLGLERPLIVTDRGSRDLPFIGRLENLLSDAGLCSGVFADISPNPRDDEHRGHPEPDRNRYPPRPLLKPAGQALHVTRRRRASASS